MQEIKRAWIDVQQNSDAWFIDRLKRATSSNFATIMANYGKSFGDPATKYAERVALEIVTGLRDERGGYTSSFMNDGHDIEPMAIEAYEMETFRTVTNGGFFTFGRLGDSPDGNVGDTGCVECKGVIATTQFKRLKKGGYDSAYKWQIQGHIWVGGKEWCDFISFCPEMPESKRLYIHRVYRDDEMIKKMEERINGQFFEEVDKNVEILNSK